MRRAGGKCHILLTAYRSGCSSCPNEFYANCYVMKIIFTVMLILVSCWGVDAKGWKGIIPLHSDRSDVERLLGTPTGECKCLYDTGSETVRVEYSKAPCVGYPSGWNVSTDKVLTLQVRPNQPLKFTDLQLMESKFYKAADDTFTRYYSSRADGIQYTVSWDGMVAAVTYIPSSNNSALRCPCFPLLDESIQRSKSFDEFQLGSIDDALARLDNYIIALLNEKRWTGYIVVYKGSETGAKRMSALKMGIMRHVLQRRAVPPKRIKVTDGGYRVKPEIELYLLTAELSPPESRGTVRPCSRRT